MPKLMGSDHTITVSAGANQEMSKKRRAALLRTAEDNEKPLDGGSKGKGRAKGDAKNVPKPRKVNKFWDEVPLTEDSVQAENFCDVIPDKATRDRATTGDDADWEEHNRKERLASREKRDREKLKRKAEADKEAARIAPSSSSSSTAKKRPKPAPKAGDPKPKVDPGSSSRASESPPPALPPSPQSGGAFALSRGRMRARATTHGRTAAGQRAASSNQNTELQDKLLRLEATVNELQSGKVRPFRAGGEARAARCGRRTTVCTSRIVL